MGAKLHLLQRFLGRRRGGSGFPRSFRLGSFLALVLSGLSLFSTATGASAAPLFQDAGDASSLDHAPSKILRKRYVRLQRSLLDGLAGRFSHPGWNPGFQLNLFDDVQLDWAVDRVWVRPGGGWVLWGSLPGREGGRVVMAYRGGVLQENAWLPGGKKFEVRYIGKGVHRVSEMDSPSLNLGDDEVKAGSTTGAWTAAQGVPVFYPQPAQSGCPNPLSLNVSQLMVLYTPLAAQNAGGQAAMETLIDLAWSGMNMAFYNSGVTAEMALVTSQQVNYTESGNILTDLENLSATSNAPSDTAAFPQLSSLMSTYGAYYVTLIVGQVAPGTPEGVAYLPGNFSAQDYLDTDITMPHELGHNFGCGHDRETQGIPVGDGFNFGYKLDSGGTTYIDVMSYQPGNYILNYSNPAVTFLGQATGVDPAAPTAADNALVLNQNFPNTPFTGANLPPAVSITSPSTGSYFAAPSPLTLTAAASSPNAGGTVAQVDFFVNDLYVGTATAAPFSISWTPPSAGTYLISATAIDGLGAMQVSCPNAVYVGIPTATITPTFTITPSPTSSPTPTASPTPAPPTVTPTPLPTAICCVSGSSIIVPFAGTGTRGYSGDNGPALSADLNIPVGLYLDAAGDLYFCDANNYVVRKVAPNGIITTVAGNGTSTYSGDGGPATLAGFASLGYVTGDAAGNIYVSDWRYDQIRKVTPGGIISTYAGMAGVLGFGGDNGPATLAELANPAGIAVDSSGDLLIADSVNFCVRKVAPNGIITTMAGTGRSGGFSGDGGQASSALLAELGALAIDPSGNIFIDDGGNWRIREINTSGVINTVAGDGTAGFAGDGGPATLAEVYQVNGFAFCNGNVYFTDDDAVPGSFRIRMFTVGGNINTIAGNSSGGPSSGNGGAASLATLNIPAGLATDGKANLYVAEEAGQVVRELVACPYTPTPTATPSCTPTPTPTLTPTGTLAPPTPTGTLPTATSTSFIIQDNFPTSTPTPSLTPTATCTSTATSTETLTTTPTEGCFDPVYFPNPVTGTDFINANFSPCDLGPGARLKLFTLAFRRVIDKDLSGFTPGLTVKLDLTDDWGKPLANGLYYAVVTSATGKRSISKWLIIR